MLSKLEKLAYDVKYSAGTYLDAFVSIPIWIAEKTTKSAERFYHKLGREVPRFLSLDYTKQNSSCYNARERLRDSLDTKPGALFIQSNIVASFPFFLIGMPASEFAQAGINRWISNAPEIVQYITNSLFTLTAQIATGYVGFMINEVRTNKDKYVNKDNKLSFRKIGNGFKNTVKAFLSYDLTYVGAKTIGQSFLLWRGKDPWKASGIFDAFAIPGWAAVCVPLGLRKGIIETKQTREWTRQEENPVTHNITL